ncbi:hypothetical protein BGW80DRAFT_1300722 [Lactifluus volemus]|nr:hypothetical protein BGW80DRAFT_1300722 [Lactifluus volemus]
MACSSSYVGIGRPTRMRAFSTSRRLGDFENAPPGWLRSKEESLQLAGGMQKRVKSELHRLFGGSIAE